MQKNKAGIYLSILLVGFGSGMLVYHFYSRPSSSFSKEFQQSKIHSRKIDSLLNLSNLKIDSTLLEIVRLKDSIENLQKQQIISNIRVNESNSQLNIINKLTSTKLHASKSKLLTKQSKIDSLEMELYNRKPQMQ